MGLQSVSSLLDVVSHGISCADSSTRSLQFTTPLSRRRNSRVMAKSKSVFWLFCAATVMMSVVLIDAQTFFTNGRYGKRSEVRSRVASRSTDERFFGGPRFGRSGTGGIPLGNSESDVRNPERFFIGSRYGKRSELEQIVPQQLSDESVSNGQDKDVFLECISIGIEQLYNCMERKNGNIKIQEGA